MEAFDRKLWAKKNEKMFSRRKSKQRGKSCWKKISQLLSLFFFFAAARSIVEMLTSVVWTRLLLHQTLLSGDNKKKRQKILNFISSGDDSKIEGTNFQFLHMTVKLKTAVGRSQLFCDVLYRISAVHEIYGHI